tara:strand:- start:771 stop:920 length:150 start_codon:yes stop_codon:yes gene_type:complete
MSIEKLYVPDVAIYGLLAFFLFLFFFFLEGGRFICCGIELLDTTIIILV